MSKRFRVVLLTAAATAIVALTFVWLITPFRIGVGTPNYQRFVNRDAAYHKNLAYECDALFRATPPDANRSNEIDGNRNSLPPLIRSLNPRLVEIGKEVRFQNDTNCHSFVIIQVGAGRAGYSIVWSPGDGLATNTRWILSANQENLSTDLFSADMAIEK